MASHVGATSTNSFPNPVNDAKPYQHNRTAKNDYCNVNVGERAGLGCRGRFDCGCIRQGRGAGGVVLAAEVFSARLALEGVALGAQA